MNSIVFQEMREARGLAYSATADFQPLAFGQDYASMSISHHRTIKSTGSRGLDLIINKMSEWSSLLHCRTAWPQMRTRRTNGMAKFNSHIACERLHLTASGMQAVVAIRHEFRMSRRYSRNK